MRTKVITILFFVCMVQLSFATEKNNIELKRTDTVQTTINLPKGTILFIKTPKDIYAKNYRSGDHFFVEMDRPVTNKGEVIIPSGAIVQMNVLESQHSKMKGSSFVFTVGGFIIDNLLREVKTESKKVVAEGKARGTLARAAIGAGIGAAFDGGSGAGKGAAIGGAAGLISPGQTICFKKGTEATFQLEEALKVDWL